MLEPVLELKVDTVDRWEDVSGNGNHAIQPNAANQPSIIANGKMFNRGSCYLFTTNDYMVIADNSLLDFTGKEITFEFWFNNSITQAHWAYIFYKYGFPALSGWAVMFDGTGTRLGFYHRGTGASIILSPTNTSIDGLWHKYSFILDGVIAWLYVDGEYDVQCNYNNLVDFASDVYVCTNSVTSSFYTGYLLRPRIYQAALTATEIASQYKMDLLTLRR